MDIINRFDQRRERTEQLERILFEEMKDAIHLRSMHRYIVDVLSVLCLSG